MIQAKESRMGNILLFSGNSEGLFDYEDVPGILQLNDEYGFYVYFNGMSNEMLSSFRPEQIKPIPLTPEILHKCGFIEKQSKWFFKNYFTDCREAVEVMVVEINIGSGRCCVADSDEGKPAYTGKRIEYLHTLQNYWYLQTGEELTVNL